MHTGNPQIPEQIPRCGHASGGDTADASGVPMTDRVATMERWLTGLLAGEAHSVAPASSDASFRRYWRVTRPGGSFVVMDAPPEYEDCGRFADLARRFRAVGLNTPEILAEDLENGFLALGDLGTRLYLDALSPATAEALYGEALAALATLQSRGPTHGLPAYDGPFLRREIELFREWLLGRHLGITLDDRASEIWGQACETLIANALEQPRVCVHRDFHSRNLMVTDPPSPGILDFQDAVVGPVTYDLVSLLKDCYIAWDPGQVTAWALGYRDLAVESSVMPEVDRERFLRWFDLMGAQRHLKACGIFARLHHRDGKPQYLADIPRTLAYVLDVAERYPELEALGALIRERVADRLETA
jgi:aminoglycoside/choline kinase family phosphotransferase